MNHQDFMEFMSVNDGFSNKSKEEIIQVINSLESNRVSGMVAYMRLPQQLKRDNDIIFAIANTGFVPLTEFFSQFDESWEYDREFILRMARSNGEFIAQIPDIFSTDVLRRIFSDREIVKEALSNLRMDFIAGHILDKLSIWNPDFLNDKGLMLLAAENSGSLTLRYTESSDPEIRLAAAKQSYEVYQWEPEYKSNSEVFKAHLKKISEGMKKAMTVPRDIRLAKINNYTVQLSRLMPYEGIRCNYQQELLKLIGYFDPQILKGSERLLAYFCYENFLDIDTLKKEAKGESCDLICDILRMIEKKQEEIDKAVGGLNDIKNLEEELRILIEQLGDRTGRQGSKGVEEK